MKTIITIALSTLFLSCVKETPQIHCNCGRVGFKDTISTTVKMRNNCTNNIKDFVLSQDDFDLVVKGKDFCLAGEVEW